MTEPKENARCDRHDVDASAGCPMCTTEAIERDIERMPTMTAAEQYSLVTTLLQLLDARRENCKLRLASGQIVRFSQHDIASLEQLIGKAWSRLPPVGSHGAPKDVIATPADYERHEEWLRGHLPRVMSERYGKMSPMSVHAHAQALLGIAIDVYHHLRQEVAEEQGRALAESDVWTLYEEMSTIIETSSRVLWGAEHDPIDEMNAFRRRLGMMVTRYVDTPGVTRGVERTTAEECRRDERTMRYATVALSEMLVATMVSADIAREMAEGRRPIATMPVALDVPDETLLRAKEKARALVDLVKLTGPAEKAAP